MTSPRLKALAMIAEARGRPVECMPELAPRKKNPCRGPLQVDHIYGGGRFDAGYKLYKAIVNGKRDLSYFRVLCRRHNSARVTDRGEFSP